MTGVGWDVYRVRRDGVAVCVLGKSTPAGASSAAAALARLGGARYLVKERATDKVTFDTATIEEPPVTTHPPSPDPGEGDIPLPMDGTDTEWAKAVAFRLARDPYQGDPE